MTKRFLIRFIKKRFLWGGGSMLGYHSRRNISRISARKHWKFLCFCVDCCAQSLRRPVADLSPALGKNLIAYYNAYRLMESLRPAERSEIFTKIIGVIKLTVHRKPYVCQSLGSMLSGKRKVRVPFLEAPWSIPLNWQCLPPGTFSYLWILGTKPFFELKFSKISISILYSGFL